MSCWNSALLVLIVGSAAQAHVVSISNGEMRLTGRKASFELRIPIYEVETIRSPEITLLNEFRFDGATRTSSECKQDADWLTCHASYDFAQPVADALEVECTLYRATVPNHIHILYTVQGENSDQQVFDQNNSVRQMRFHPPSFRESLTRDGGAGMLRLLKSPAGILFLMVIALASRSARDALILGAAFLLSEWAVRPISPFIPLALSPEFLEAVMTLTVAYLAGELLLLSEGSARWVIVPLLGLIHGLPFVAFPPLYLGGAALLQGLLIGIFARTVLRMPVAWRKPAAGLSLAVAILLFTRLMIA